VLATATARWWLSRAAEVLWSSRAEEEEGNIGHVNGVEEVKERPGACFKIRRRHSEQ
jgi:hypothetical protein